MGGCPGCGESYPASARFCPSCGASLAGGCAACGAILPSHARFCPQCGAPTATQAAGAPEMIKLVTIMFADVVGSTAQAEQMHPEDTRALIADLFEAMSEEIHAEGGTIERLIGDALMVDFGVPVARTDDPARAVRAGRRMLARLERWNEDRPEPHRIRIRIGINTGDVSTGGSYGEQLMVMGDAVNVAARLQQAAEPNTIVIGERTAQAVRDHFELQESEPLEVKGKAGKVTAFLVAGERHLEARVVTPFVGRAAELEALRDVLERARLKRSGVVATIVGEPGAGKSRLIAELVAIASDAKVVEGACSPFGQSAALRPFQEVLRAEAGIVGTDPPEVELDKIRNLLARLPLDPSLDRERATAALGATFGVRTALERFAGLDPREAQREVLAAWQTLLTALAADMPVIVVVEDLQWADEGTLRFIGELAGAARVPVAFLCAARPELLEERAEWIAALGDHASIRLQPLDEDESVDLVSALLDSPDIPAPLVDEMLAKAEGNPFFLEEIVRRLIDLGHLEQQDGGWTLAEGTPGIEVPDNVRLTVQSRIDLLSPEHRQVLQQASVVGRVFWSGAVRELTALADVDPLLEGLQQSRFVTERFPSAVPGETEFGFLHALIREVAYEGLPRSTRGRTHAAAAAWVEKVRGEGAEESSELLAYHYDRAFEALGDEASRRAARRYSTIAARGAQRRFAIQQAEVFGRKAVELSTAGQERIEALEVLADLYTLVGDGDGAWQAYRDALTEVRGMGGEGIQADVARLAAKGSVVATRWEGTLHTPVPKEDVQQVMELGLNAVGEVDSPDRALLLVARSFFQIYGYEDRDEKGEEAAHAALRIAEQLRQPELISAAIDAVAGCLMPESRYGEAYEVTMRRAELISQLEDVTEICDVHAMAAWCACFVGRYREAVEHATACIQRAEGIDARSYLHGLVWRAQARFMVGDWDGALADHSEIRLLRPPEEGGLPPAVTIRSYAVAAFCAQLRGDVEEAESYMELFRRFKRETGGSSTFAAPFALAARALAHRGQAAEARGWLHTAPAPYLVQHLEALCDLVPALGEPESTKEILTMARSEAERGQLLALNCFADRLAGRIATMEKLYPSARTMLKQSAEGFAALGAPWEEAYSRLLLGEVLMETGEKNTAVEEVRSALQTFERLRSRHEEERSRKLLAQV